MQIFDLNNIVVLDIDVDDNSFRFKQIMGDNTMTLYFSLPEFIELPLGAWCEFKEERYMLFNPENFKKIHTRNWEYTVVLDSYQKVASTVKFKFFTMNAGVVEGSFKLKFSLTATPQEFAQLIIDNLNQNDSDGGWTVGTCIVSDPVTLDFNHEYCDSVVTKVASAFETEWEFENKILHFRPVEKMKESAIDLEYGYNKGILGGITRTQYDDSKIINRVYVEGGDRNIDKSTYGNDTLLMPKLRTITYGGIEYKTDASGSYIERSNRTGRVLDDGLDLTKIYPRRNPVGTVSSVVVVDDSKSQYDIIDLAIPEALDYSQLRITGEKITLIFQTGMLSGKEFEIEQSESGVNGYVHAQRRFMLVPITQNGLNYPQGALIPEPGDKYVVFHVRMPELYIQTAETEMLNEAVSYLNKNEQVQFTYRWPLDELYAKRNWGVIGGYLNIGYFVNFSDPQFQQQKVAIRITSVKEFINKPKSPVIELSNNVSGKTLTSVVNEISAAKQTNERTNREVLNYTRRRFQDAQETFDMLSDTVDGYSASINPISIQAMAILLGDESLQFQFVTNMTDQDPDHGIVFDFGVSYAGCFSFHGGLAAGAMLVQHMSLGIKTMSPAHAANEYKYWSLPAYKSAVLDPDKAYYMYIKCSKAAQTGVMMLSETRMPFNTDPTYYYMFVGILNSEYAGQRSFVTFYGYSEFLPGRITTDELLSTSGNTRISLLHDILKLGEKLKYNILGDGKLEIDGSILQHSTIKDDGGNESVIALDRGPFMLSKHPFYPGNITTFEGAAYYCHTETIPGVIPTNTNYFRPYSEKGNSGANPIYGYLTNENNPLSANATGVVADYSKAKGQFKLFKGEEDVTPYSSFKAVAKDCEGTIVESQQLFHDWADGVVQGHLDTSANWQELSGLTAAYKAGNEKYLWVLSDSPANMIAAIKKADASNQGVWSLSGNPSKVDWEDIESSVVAGVPYLYVFDYGNNPNNINSRGAGIDMVIHRILEPTITGANGNTAEYISIPCVFPAANLPTHRDSEGSIIDPVTGDIYIITKREAIPGVYKLAHQDNYVGIQTLTYMGKMWDVPDVTTSALGATACNVVDATINKAGTEIIVKNYNDMYLFLRNPATQSIFQALQGIPTVVAGYVGGGSATPAKSHPSAEPQGEGICFDEMGLHLYSHSEYATGSAAGRFPLFKYSRINAASTTFSMQEGVVVASAIYAGTRDTYIWDTNPDTAYGAATTFVIDNANATDVDRRKGLLRFELAGGVGIPADAIIVGARLDLNIAVEGQGYLMYKMLVPWTEASTFNSLGGITPDGIKASATPDCVNAINLDTYVGQVRNNVPISTVQEWISNPEKNFGWMFDAADAATGDGVQISSREDAVIANRPKLTIRYILPSDLAGFYKVTSMPSTVNNAEIKLTGTFDGITIEKLFSLSKSKVGATGLTGASAALMPNRMNWVSGATYEGSLVRQDLARNPGDGVWYRANPNAGVFTDAVWTPAHWISFGYSGDSVATILLLAELANIANFIFKNGKMISQSGTINGAPSMDYANASFVPNLSLDGNTGKIEANDAVIRGRIEAIVGKIGNFTISGNSLLSDSMEFSETALETLTVLTAPLTYSINEPSAGAWTASGTAGNGITVMTLPITLPIPAVISFETTISVGGDYKLWEVFVEGADGSVPYYLSRNYSVTERHEKALPAGSYNIRVYAYSTGLNSIQLKGLPIVDMIRAIAYVKKSKIGNNGLLSFQDSTHYLYYSFLAGLVSRGGVDIPAGLGGGYVSSAGGVSSIWGKYAPISAPKAGSTVTINHGIGDTNYMINVSPKDSASTWYWTNKTANTIQVVISGAFDFSLQRTI